ncbi:hypothetical protein TNIN_170981 [Trichonephila inaurata madagascariensis]|uniref:Uncharacterized protein n=1 Tax=Trichonephila inaurata madagascariensis TaxID=2747483 RepID=A0A8X7CDD9_9ARAC|nr:hypothetical protein TNIN_170981 [Trichonephila inaurata madagascariensis]
MNISLAISQLEEKVEKCSVIADNKLIEKLEDVGVENTIKGPMKSDTAYNQNKDGISNGIDTTRSFKKFSPLTKRTNISETSEHISALSSETNMAKGTKFPFFDNNAKIFIINNDDFEEEEKELKGFFLFRFGILFP